MFRINSFNALDPLEIYLAKPDGTLLYPLNSAIDEDSASLTPGINKQYELVFTINSKVADSETNELIDTLGYEQIVEGMYLVVENVGLFRLAQPDYNSDGVIETKDVVAYSCDCELENLVLNNIEINMGTETSQEYLVTYENGETEELVNEYTNIPYDWILLYNTLPEQLRNLKTKYIAGYFGTPNTEITVTDNLKITELDSLCKIIPRLTYKINKNASGNITGRTDYVTYTYTGDAISSILLSPSFGARIDRLITFYDKYHKQLSLLDIIIEKTNNVWSVGEVYGLSQGDYELCNRKYQFETSETIYSFLTQTLSTTIECVVNFDIMNRKINIIPADKIGEYTGIFLSYDNLVNNINISCDESKLASRLYVTGADDLSIEYANIGQPYIEDLTYKMNARNSSGERIYVSDDLASKYQNYLDFWNQQRKPFMSLSREWAQYNSEIFEITYRVPLDSLKINWGTYKKEELEQAFTTYNNLLAALITMYKNDYGSVGLNPDGSVNENYIKTTEYWWDYAGYKNTIVEIRAAMDTYPFYSNQSKWTQTQIANWKEAIKAWETDWTLYGTSELQIKIASYEDKMQMLIDRKLVFRVSSQGDELKPWSALTEAERKECGNIESSYNNSVKMYNEYMKHHASALQYLGQLQAKVKEKETLRDNVQMQRQAIKDKVDKSKFFTVDERKTLNLLYRDAAYTNENILITSIDTPITAVDVQNELVEDAKEKLSILSRPQLKFSVEMNNFLSLIGFKSLWKDFKLWNYIMLEYRDGTYVKLRLTGYTFNPISPSSKDSIVEFSSYIISSSKITDTSFLLNMAATDGLSSYGSGSSGGGGKLDDTITNSMLSKLLNSETFGTRVSNIVLDTMVLNEMTAKKAIFSGFNKGETSIDGQWIKTGWITDASYNGDTAIGNITNTAGSIINLNDGKFNFAGGRLVWDGKILHIQGEIAWDNVTGTEHVMTDAQMQQVKQEIENAFNQKINIVQEQADKKAETWYQATDPSIAWVEQKDKNIHHGDLWYNTTNDKTFSYNSVTNSWDELKATPPQEVFNKIDGKAQVFMAQPTPPYNVGDIWFDSATSEIMTCVKKKIDGELFAQADWEKRNKYIDDTEVKKLKEFAEITYPKDLQGLQALIDGQIETFYYDYEPTLTNIPASEWTTEKDKEKHVGDLFFWKTQGYAYRFLKDGLNYTWQLVKDTDVTKALKDAKDAKDTADGKRRVFTAVPPQTPTPPYDEGDLWVQGENGILMRCRVSKIQGSVYSESDWIKAVGYDNKLQDFIKNQFEKEISALKTQIDGKVETWRQNTDPSVDWTTDELKNQHNGDLWYDITSGKTFIYEYNSITPASSKWQPVTSDVPKELWDKVDGKAQIFTTTTPPTPPYHKGDLWFAGENADIMTCISTRTTGNYVETDWKKYNKYTDDSKANEVNTSLSNLTTILGFDGTRLTGTYIYSPNLIGGHLVIGNKSGVYAEITSDGHLSATGVTISGDITAESGSFTGAIHATSLTLGNGVTIDYDNISNKPTIPSTEFFIEKGHIVQNSLKPDTSFLVDNDGLLTAKNAVIYGTIYASNGTFAGDVFANNITAQRIYKLNYKEFGMNNPDVISKEAQTIIAGSFEYNNKILAIGSAIALRANGSLESLESDSKSALFFYYDAYQNTGYVSCTAERFDCNELWVHKDIMTAHGFGIALRQDNTSRYICPISSGLGLGSADGEVNLGTNNNRWLKVAAVKGDFRDSLALSGVEIFSWSDLKKYVTTTGTTYTAGNGISISASNEISVNTKYLDNLYAPKGSTGNFPYTIGKGLTTGNPSGTLRVQLAGESGNGATVGGLTFNSHGNLMINDAYLNNWGNPKYITNISISGNTLSYIKNGYTTDLNLPTSSSGSVSGSYIKSNGNTTLDSLVYIYGASSGAGSGYACLGMGYDSGKPFISSEAAYHYTGGSTSNMVINSSGTIKRTGSSSMRYKHDIRDADFSKIQTLYNLPVRLYKYNFDYLSDDDQRYGQDFIGFIAEEVYELYPEIVDMENNQVEMWNVNMMVACQHALIKNNHKEIQELKSTLLQLQGEISILKQKLGGI